MVEGGGFEPPKLARQIYSLIPLATREPLRKAAYCPDGLIPCQPFIPIKLLTYIAFQLWPGHSPAQVGSTGIKCHFQPDFMPQARSQMSPEKPS